MGSNTGLMVSWFNGLPEVFRNNPHVSQHTKHTDNSYHIIECMPHNIMFVTHTVY